MQKETVSGTPNNPVAIQTVELLKRRWLSKNTFEIELTRPAAFEFKAGHTICFIHESMERYYSLLTTPDDPTLALCVFYVPHGSFSHVLAHAEIGTRFNVSGPHGYFIFKPSARSPVFVATGTGIAPFVSFARSGIKNFILFHEATSAGELYYRAYFKKLESVYHPCLPEEKSATAKPEGMFQGHVAACIKTHLSRGTYDFYLCGHREMIRNVTLLVDDRFPGSHVYTEVFF